MGHTELLQEGRAGQWPRVTVSQSGGLGASEQGDSGHFISIMWAGASKGLFTGVGLIHPNQHRGAIAEPKIPNVTILIRTIG